MKRPVAQRLRDALGVMSKADDFVGAMTIAEFAADDKAVFAVERCFTVLGEALRPMLQRVLDTLETSST